MHFPGGGGFSSPMGGHFGGGGGQFGRFADPVGLPANSPGANWGAQQSPFGGPQLGGQQQYGGPQQYGQLNPMGGAQAQQMMQQMGGMGQAQNMQMMQMQMQMMQMQMMQMMQMMARLMQGGGMQQGGFPGMGMQGQFPGMQPGGFVPGGGVMGGGPFGGGGGIPGGYGGFGRPGGYGNNGGYGNAGNAGSTQSSGGPPGSAPSGQMKDWIAQAKQILVQSGIPADKLSDNDINIIVQHESGGNPNAENNWDSNAKAGHPSKGLMQTIDSTFQANSVDGHKNIWNPVDNIVAGVRYAIKRYGSLDNVPGVQKVKQGGKYVGY